MFQYTSHCFIVLGECLVVPLLYKFPGVFSVAVFLMFNVWACRGLCMLGGEMRTVCRLFCYEIGTRGVEFITLRQARV